MSEFQSASSTKEGRYSASTFKDKKVIFAEVGDLAIFEGDIVLGKAANVSRWGDNEMDPMGTAQEDPRYRWKGGVVPYYIESGFPNPERVHEAIKHWEAKTNILFKELSGADLNSYPDHVVFVDRGDCWSYVGRQGGEQLVSLGPDCGVGNAIHEIGHTVGLWHEQGRSDRDNHVKIVWENIEQKREHNFDQHVTDGDDIGAYDYSSIMHYPATAFSSNGKATIVALNGADIGQREGLSVGDISTVNTLYPGAKKS